MKRTTLAATLALFALLAPSVARPQQAVAGPAADQIAALEARVASLEVRVTALEARPSATPALPTPTPTPTSTPTPTPGSTPSSPPPSATPSPSPVKQPICPSSLQSAIDATPNGGTLDVTGCSFSSTTAIRVANRSSLTVVGGTLSSSGYHPAFTLSCDSNVTLRGWKIVGSEPQPGTYVAGQEDAHGVNVQGGTSIRLESLDIAAMQGDGIYLAQCGTTNGNGVTITDLYAHRNGRMGIAVVAFNGVTALRSRIEDAGFRAIDVEPDCNGSYQQQAMNLVFDGGTIGGWIRKDPNGTIYGTSWAYVGTPTCGGGNVPRVENVTFRNFAVDVTSPTANNYWMSIEPTGYRVKGVVIDNNSTADTVYATDCNHADGVTFTNNRIHLNPSAPGPVVSNDCTGVQVTGNVTN